METSDESDSECLKIHTCSKIYSTSSDSYSGREDFDETYEKLKPPPEEINVDEHHVVVIHPTNKAKPKRNKQKKAKEPVNHEKVENSQVESTPSQNWKQVCDKTNSSSGYMLPGQFKSSKAASESLQRPQRCEKLQESISSGFGCILPSQQNGQAKSSQQSCGIARQNSSPDYPKPPDCAQAAKKSPIKFLYQSLSTQKESDLGRDSTVVEGVPFLNGIVNLLKLSNVILSERNETELIENDLSIPFLARSLSTQEGCGSTADVYNFYENEFIHGVKGFNISALETYLHDYQTCLRESKKYMSKCPYDMDEHRDPSFCRDDWSGENINKQDSRSRVQTRKKRKRKNREHSQSYKTTSQNILSGSKECLNGPSHASSSSGCIPSSQGNSQTNSSRSQSNDEWESSSGSRHVFASQRKSSCGSSQSRKNDAPFGSDVPASLRKSRNKSSRFESCGKIGVKDCSSERSLREVSDSPKSSDRAEAEEENHCSSLSRSDWKYITDYIDFRLGALGLMEEGPVQRRTKCTRRIPTYLQVDMSCAGVTDQVVRGLEWKKSEENDKIGTVWKQILKRWLKQSTIMFLWDLFHCVSIQIVNN